MAASTKVWHKVISYLSPLEQKTEQFYKVLTPYLDYLKPIL